MPELEQLNFKVNPESKAIMYAVQKDFQDNVALNMSMTAVVNQLFRDRFKQRNLTLPPIGD